MRTNGRYGKIELYPMYERMNGNGELTEMENVIFYVSYGVLTEFLRMNAILTYFATETGIRQRLRHGYVTVETRHWSAITVTVTGSITPVTPQVVEKHSWFHLVSTFSLILFLCIIHAVFYAE